MSRTAMLLALASSMTTAAVVRADAPATRPAAAAATTVDVYVLPFQPLNLSPALDWTGRAVQQTLVTDAAAAGLRAVAAPQPGDTPAADARSAARAAGAKYVVTGTYQWADPQVRLTGQVVDAATGTAVGSLSATGDGRDLFALEDSLSHQLVDRLHNPSADPARLPGSDQTAARSPAKPVPPALAPAAVATAIAPPAAGATTSYQGSTLQAYVDANRTPSVDYTQQVIDARDRNVNGSYNAGALAGGFGGAGFGGIGFGGLGYGGLGYGGVGYGGFGYGGFGTGGYLLGVSYPVSSVGFGYGGGFAGHGGFGGGVGYGGFGYNGVGTGLGRGGYFAGRGYNPTGGFGVSGGGFGRGRR